MDINIAKILLFCYYNIHLKRNYILDLYIIWSRYIRKYL